MIQPMKRARDRSWTLILACILVFLFAFHAKTAIYGQGLKLSPHTATSTKLWVKNQRIPKPDLTATFIATSISFDHRNLTWSLCFLHSHDASAFVPVPCFSGLSPPLTI